MGRRAIFRLLVAGLVFPAGLLLPATVAAHPLGNFTINHYAGLTIGPDRVELDVVIDMAEIPAFQERQTMDGDGDGSVSDAEAAAWSVSACADLRSDLHLARGTGADLALVEGTASAVFPPGAGGLSTLRLSCAYTAALTPAIGADTVSLVYRDTSYAERIGWREILATGNGTILDTHGLPPTSPSQKLTAYPADLIQTPLDIRSATIDARLDPNGPAATPSPASAPPSSTASGGAGSGTGGGSGGSGATARPGAVPGGVAGELPDIFRTADLTPFVILASLLTAIGIGAAHAVTPGHGKTLMAAYLVGSRGTAIHAVGLGLSVAVSHTIGILALALIIVGAGSILPPDVVYRVTPIIAGTSIILIGGWMFISEVRRRRRAAVPAGAPHEHSHAADNDPAGAHPAEHGRTAEPEHAHDHGDHAHEHGDHAHGDHEQGPDHAHDHAHEQEQAAPGEHSHGGVRHSHLPPAGTTLTWRGLFVLGLAGGLIPSASALLILLSSIAAGRPAFGLILVVAFGLGMALVMTGVGLAMIFARTRLDRMPSRSSLGRLAAVAPLVASVAVLGLGIVLTWQAVAGSPVL